jgi:hypothetical protein
VTKGSHSRRMCLVVTICNRLEDECLRRFSSHTEAKFHSPYKSQGMPSRHRGMEWNQPTWRMTRAPTEKISCAEDV